MCISKCPERSRGVDKFDNDSASLFGGASDPQIAHHLVHTASMVFWGKFRGKLLRRTQTAMDPLQCAVLETQGLTQGSHNMAVAN